MTRDMVGDTIGIVVGKNYIILNSATQIDEVGYYLEEVKDDKGVKRKKRHSYFELHFGDHSIIRFERNREDAPKFPHRHVNHTHAITIYADESLHDLRGSIIKAMK